MNHSAGLILITFICLLLLVLLSGCSALYNYLGGPFLPAEKIFTDEGLDDYQKGLIEKAFSGFENQELNDYHVHFFGNGLPEKYSFCPELNDTDIIPRPKMNMVKTVKDQKWYYRPFVKGVYLDTINVSDISDMDEQYIKRLIELVANYGPPRYADQPINSPYSANFYLMAMDGKYNEDGTLSDQSYNYVSNDYIVKLVECLNAQLDSSGGFVHNRFVPVGSINPMQKSGDGYVMREEKTWSKEIDLLYEEKVRWIKWRPGSMGIDPEKVSDEFYKKLESREIGILTHTGSSNGVKLSEEENLMAAPKKMLKAADLGVRVVLLHMGRTGENKQTGADFSTEFFCVMDIASRDNDLKIRGEISAVPYAGTHSLLSRINSYPAQSFINGSDYPAVTPYILVKPSLDKLSNPKLGWLSKEEVGALKQIYKFNPLLFDFVLKRTLSINGSSLPQDIFTAID